VRLVAEGDVVVCHNTWTGTYGGTAFRGVTTPQGKLFSVEHIHIYRLAEGKIAEHWVVRDDRGRSAINRTPNENSEARADLWVDVAIPLEGSGSLPIPPVGRETTKGVTRPRGPLNTGIVASPGSVESRDIVVVMEADVRRGPQRLPRLAGRD